MTSLKQLWTAVLADLALQLERATFERLLRHSQLIRHEGPYLTISVPNSSAQAWLSQRLRPLVQRAAAAILKRTIVRLRFVVAQTADA